MTATTPAGATTSAAQRPVVRRSPVQRTVRWLLRTHLFLALCFWGIVALGVTLTLIVWSTVSEPTQSIVSYARQGAIWFPFSLFIMVVSAYLPVHIGLGMTRRALVRGAVLTAMIMAAVYAATMTLAFELEGLVFGAFGWVHGPGEMAVSGATEPLSMAFELFLIFLAANLCGLLVGIVYYRLGGWVGTLSLPLTVGPILIVSGLGLAAAGPFATDEWFERFALGRLEAAGLAILVLAVVALVFSGLSRRVEVHTAPA